MSTDQRSADAATTLPSDHLGHLLKHAHRRLGDLQARALAPLGVDYKEWTVMIVLAPGGLTSQQDLAQRLGVDRTTMVALLDSLETKGLLVRRPDAQDRRRNAVELTATGLDTLKRATKAIDEAERQFLSPLRHKQAQHLRDALRTLVRP